ncbi:dihydroneopterin aldolase [Legionella sp. W05-934-2]|jgi:dihydroneopterin aldolase|uniref:dihydroneopterin aldolase n=1 Tax=Legionella sp. W05-934-2 TaxID=1198649 RepID=UPI00346298FF
MDEIVIESLSLQTRIGVNQWEQAIDQCLLVDLHLYVDFKAINDHIDETINYDLISQHINAYVTKKSFQLIETVANDIAQEILTNFPIQQVKIVVNKPYALKQAKNVRVIAIRSKTV